MHHEQPQGGELLERAAFVVRRWAAQGPCFIFLMLPAVANTTWHFLSHAPCRASERRWGCSQGRRERGARSARSSSSSICLTLVLSCPAAGGCPEPLLPGKGADHVNAPLFGQRQIRQEEKALEKDRGSSQPGRHCLLFSAESPGSSTNLLGTGAAGHRADGCIFLSSRCSRECS